jgi:hypothetical protein
MTKESLSEKRENVDALITILNGDRNRRTQIFMQARDILRKIIPDHAEMIFNGLFERPKRYEQNALCILGRIREEIGELTPHKIRALAELSNIEGFGFVVRLLEDAVLVKKESPADVPDIKEEIEQKMRYICGTELISERQSAS